MSTATATDRVLLMIGSGPGIGNAVASLFAAKRFNKVALLARNGDRLLHDKSTVESAARSVNREVDVKTWKVDVSKLDELEKTLKEVQTFGEVELVYFNAARVQLGELFEQSVEEIRYDFEITNLALYVVARWAVPLLRDLASRDATAQPSLLVTGGLLHESPFPNMFSLSLTKTAQRNLLQSMDMVYGKAGVHIGIVVVGGDVSPEEKTLNPTNIAEQAWKYFSQKREDWTFEVVIM